MVHVRVSLTPSKPYQITRHLRAFTLPGRPVPGLYDDSSKTYRVLLCIRSSCAPIKAVFRGEPWDTVILLDVYDGGDIGEVAKLAKLYFRVDFDYNEFMERLRGYKRLYELARKYSGLRPGRCLSLYNALIDSIIKQRISLSIALHITSRLIALYGRKTYAEGELFYGYPEPRKLIEAGIDGLRRLKLTKMKSRALVEVAMAEEEGRLPSLREVEEDPHTVSLELQRLYGVGRWTAQLAVAMVSPRFPLGPLDDLAVKRGLSRVLGQDVSEPLVRRLRSTLGDLLGLVMYLAALEYEESKA